MIKILIGKSAKKSRNEPKDDRTHTLSKPIGSNFSARGLILIESIVASIISVKNSTGIISNATIYSLKLKTASAFAGKSIAKKGINIIICCEGTIDQIH